MVQEISIHEAISELYEKWNDLIDSMEMMFCFFYDCIVDISNESEEYYKNIEELFDENMNEFDKLKV